MKRLWAVIVIATVSASCRSSQPTTNPFLRTTVPPPPTQGMMVMPGEAAPPAVTMPPGAAPPAVAPAVPVTPAQPAPLIAPPPASPESEEFHPPGGSYLYHQSSNERPPRHGPGALGAFYVDRRLDDFPTVCATGGRHCRQKDPEFSRHGA